jgi:hypothetical protein
VRLEGLGKLKNPMNPSGIETANNNNNINNNNFNISSLQLQAMTI